ncbi:hypothetical protein Trydic_g8931 [Trypoxylus dichotomus]
MVDYFTKNIYDTCMPSEIKTEFESIGYDNIINYILNRGINEGVPNLNNFIEMTKKFMLCNRKDVCRSVEDLQRRLNESGCKNTPGVHLNVYMRPKKSHEVEILSAVAASLKTIGDVSHLVDIGDGKGYLSSLLSLHYKIPVLGIDAIEINTIGAIKRAEKLGKSWHGIVGTNKSILPKSEQRLQNPDSLLYKQITQYITEKTNLKELVKNIFDQDISYLGIVGLHTCGDLAPSALKIYVNNNDVRTICNVSCCYHLLSERTLDEKDEDHFGFPMSKFLKDKEFYLGRNARMLSAHSTDRILDRKQLPNKNVFHRAVFEVFLNQHFPDLNTREVGRFKMSNVEFNVYAKRALKKLDIGADFSDEELDDFYKSFGYKQSQLYAFSLLRSMLAPLIETLILLDRLLYLNESGFENSYLVQLFDPVVSPRCYGIVSFKKM